MEIKSSKENKVLIIFFLVIILSIIFESIVVDKISLFIVFVSLLVLGKLEQTIINPYYLFAITPLSLLIYFNISDFYMFDLTHKTYLLALINIIAFIVAFMLTSRVKKKQIKQIQRDSKLILKINIYILFFLSLLGSVIPPLSSVLWLFAIPGIVGAFKTKEKMMLILVAVYILFAASINLSKMQVLLYLITILLSLEKFFFHSKKQRIWIKVFVGFGIVFMVFAFSFANKDRGDYNAKEGLSYYGDQGVEWSYDASFFLPYMYITNGWTNLQLVVEKQDTRTYGLWVLKPFLGYLNLDKELDLEKSYELVPNSSFNTFTFVTVGFKDFGYWLSILSPMILGFFVKKVYTRFLISDSPFDIATYVIFALAIAEMFFSNHFYMLSYPFTMLFLRWFYKSFVKSI